MRFLVVLAFIVIAGCAVAQPVITSDFSANVDGWTCPNAKAGTFLYNATGGNPGGHLSAQTFGSYVTGAGTYWYPFFFVTPAKFSGDLSAYANGGLSFDISQVSLAATAQYPAVILTTTAGISYYYYPNTMFAPPTDGTWQNFTVPLSNTSGEWKTLYDPLSTPVATTAFTSALSTVDHFEIQGLYRNGNVIGRIDNVNLRPPLTVPTQPVSAVVCEGVTATFTGIGGNNPSITYQWQLFNPFSGFQNIANSAVYSNVTTSTLSINTTGNVGAGQYRVRIFGAGVPSVVSNTVTLTINPAPTAPGASGAARCGTGSVTLTATGGTAGSYRWYTVATGGTAIPGQTAATYTTPSIATTTNYWVAINNGTCESTRTLVTATINNTTPPTTTDAARCGPGSVTVSAAGGTAGQYRWYTVATGGTALAGQTAATYTTPSISGTTNYWVSIDNGICESTRTIVTATINSLPAAPGGTGASGCNPSSVTLTATGGAAGQYRWYTVATGGTAIPGQTNATYATPTLTVTTNYWVSINNGTCEGPRTQLIATINNPPTAPGGTGSSGCNPSSVTLTATGGVAGQYRWYTVATGGTAIPGQTNATYITPVLTVTTNYWVSIDNGTCESARTQLIATINNPPTAPGGTGSSGCNPSSVTLTATGAAAGQYRWYTVATGGTAIPGQTNATYATPVLTVTTNYWVSINNGTCESARTLLIATINNPPTAPGGSGAAGCNPSSVTLTATGGAAGQYRWYTVATGGTAIPGQTNATYATPVLTVTTNYWVSINNGTCESARTQLIATINNPPSAPGATGASGCNPTSVTLTATGAAAGQYRWYTVATGGTAIPGQTNATYATPSLTITTNYWVSINNGLCESARTQVTATIVNYPSAPGATGGSSCVAASVTLTATGAAAGQYRWYTVATGGAAIPGQTNASYSTPVISATTNYWVSINNGTCEGARTMVIATIGNPPSGPAVTGASGCAPAAGSVSVTLTANGAAAGQYRWYTVATGGTAIPGQTSDTYVTPSLSTTTNYWVSINNGCEGPRTQVTATINTIPTAPGQIGATGCPGQSVVLQATGGLDGQFRWYTTQTGATQIPGQVSGTYTTPPLNTTTDFWVSVNNGFCESGRIRTIASIFPCQPNTAPVIETTIASTTIGGIVTINLQDLISDDDDNLDLSTLTIVSQPQSGAKASIDAKFNLVIDYTGRQFTGTENIVISVCDALNACSQQTLSIEVDASVVVYNALSPNNDGKNEVFYISNIENLPGTQKNKVTIFNRWGDLVWEGVDYNNTTVVFTGKSKNNTDLPSGTYYYKIEFSGGQKSENGYLSLKR